MSSRGATLSERAVDKAASFLGNRFSRRGFLGRTAVVGSALAVAPMRYVLRPGTAYAAICGGTDNSCRAGYTVFCCTINGGVNACPPGTFTGGWWKADNSPFCCGNTARYYLDCHPTCSCGCGSGHFCNPRCVSCSARCSGDPCDARRVCWNYFRYGQCHQEISCSGPVACRVVTCTPPWVLDPSCGTTSATDNNTRNHDAPCTPGCSSPIDEKWQSLGGARSVLGQPVTGEVPAPDGVGKYRHFERGSIYWTPNTGAHEVHGSIKLKWAEMGWERSPLGYPVTDERVTPDLVGRYNAFEFGSIYASPTTGVFSVRGSIRDTWAALGWEGSALGYPTTDEHPTPDGRGRFNLFQHGAVYWTGTTGACEVRGRIFRLWASMGYEASLLGYPVTNELGTPDGIGRYNAFEGGMVYSTPATGAHAVHGAILLKWAQLRHEASAIGYPVAEVEPVAGAPAGSDARVQRFQHGRIYTSTATGPHEVRGRILAAYLEQGGPTGRLGFPVSDEYVAGGVKRGDFERGSITWDGRITIIPR